MQQLFVLLLFLIILPGCELLPEQANSEQALPRPDLDLRTTSPGDLIRLRRLTSADFGAERPLSSASPGDIGLGLSTSLSILVSPYATLGFRPLEDEDGEEQFELLAKNIHYMAVLDRRYSWLSPDLTPRQQRYVLAYAYVRFSLYESAARRLTQAAAEQLAKGYRGAQPLALVQQFTDAMATRLEQELATVATEMRTLERSTALTINSEQLVRWNARFEHALQASESFGYGAYMTANFPGALNNTLERITFTEAGLYDPGPCEGMVLKLQSLGHFGCVSSQAPRFVQSARQIPLRKGVTFGLRFVPHKLPDGQWAELDVITVYPKPGVRPPDSDKIFASNLAQILANSGKASPTNLYLYQLTEDWELLPGTWRFEFYSQGRKIDEQTFELIAP